MMANQWMEWGRSALAALVTISVAASSVAQPPTRIGDNSSEFGSFDRVIREGTQGLGRRADPFRPQTQVDVARVDSRVVRNLLTECVTESERLYRALEQDYRRAPEIRSFLTSVSSMRMRASRASQDIQRGVGLDRLLPEFQQLGSEWRNVSHRMSQSRQLSRATIDSVERIDRLERELEKLFKMEPQFDRLALLTEFSRLESAISNLVQELELDRGNGDDVMQLIYDARKLDQQASLLQSRVFDQYTYTDIVNDYSRFSQMWRNLVPRLRRLNNRYIERSVANVVLSDTRLHDLLWLEHQTSRENLKMIAESLSRDVDEFFNRVPLRLLLHFKNVASILQTADDFYGTVQNLQDCIERNESDQEIRECYRHVEDYGTQFVRAFEPLRSSSGRVVLREIEDGMLALRNELNIAGTVDAVDVRSLIQTAARLEVLADHLEMDVTQWLNYERPSFATQAAQASDRFVQQAQRLHRSLQSRPTAAELKREVENLYVEFERIYGYLGRCRTEDRAHLKSIAYEIGAELNKIRSPLNL